MPLPIAAIGLAVEGISLAAKMLGQVQVADAAKRAQPLLQQGVLLVDSLIREQATQADAERYRDQVAEAQKEWQASSDALDAAREKHGDKG